MDIDQDKLNKFLAHQESKARKSRNNRIALLGIGAFLLFAYAANPNAGSSTSAATSTSAAPSKAAEAGCSHNWHECKDNAELMNSNNQVVITAGANCYVKADRASKYGDGSWGWIKFGKFYPGDDYIKTGIMTTIDDNVTFSNGYGAQVRSEVICRYNMKTGTVESVDISERS